MTLQRSTAVAALVATCAFAAAGTSAAKPKSGEASKEGFAPKAWCSPDVVELSDHVCWFDGGVPSDGRRTLVVYLHGAYVASPGFQWLQQSALAMHAKRHQFTLLLPTAPKSAGGYVWPTSERAQKEDEAAVLQGIKDAKAELERRAGKPFDETFVVGFSSGAYYASSLAVRSALDVDGYIVLAGGSSWSRPVEGGASRKRAPIFVGISAADKLTANHSRAFAGTLAALGWPRRVEERDVGHTVDWTFLAHGLAWLRRQSGFQPAVQTASLRN